MARTGMRVLVTGATGYIGSVLVPMLELRGHTVTGLDLGLYAAAEFGDGPKPADHRDVRSLEPADVAGHDAVIHLAGISNDPVGNLDASLTYDINYTASVRLAELAREAGVERFLFSSSCSLYGATESGRVTEEAEFAPITPYAESKVLVERDLQSLASDSFSPTYLRNATVYGPSPCLRLDLVVNNLVAWAVATGALRLQSDGTPWRPQVHVEDVARAFTAALESPREVVHNEAFNVGRSNQNHQIREIAEMVSDAVGGVPVEFEADAGPDPRSYRVDFTKIERTLLEYRPQWTVRKGVAQLVEQFREAGMSTDSFSTYTRLLEIRRLQSEGRLTDELRWKTVEVGS